MSVNNHASETLRGPLPPNAELLPAFEVLALCRP